MIPALNLFLVYDITHLLPLFIYNTTDKCPECAFVPDAEFVSDRELPRNVTVNVYVVNERWLFSLLWCAGASSVTTNDCKALNEMEQPDWTMVSDVHTCTNSSCL